MSIRPIETHYRGCRFRSRLEARWAVFFDALGVPWEYEPEGFPLERRYLPDFFLPTVNRGCYIEIKRMISLPTSGPIGREGAEREVERHLCMQLAAVTRRMVYLATGYPPGFEYRRWPEPPSRPASDDSIEAFWPRGNEGDGPDGDGKGWDIWHAFCVCRSCGAVGIHFMGRSERISCCDANRASEERIFNANHHRILAAARAARGARFEHGEQPRMR